MPSVPLLANTGAMNTFIGAFEVTSKLSGHVYNAASRTSGTPSPRATATPSMPNSWSMTKAELSACTTAAFVEFRSKAGRDLTDREASFVAAEYLRERLEEEDVRPLYDVTHEEVTRLIQQVGIK